MLVSSAPLRVSFCGGGSDISSYYNQKDGAVLTSTIQQYVYVVVNKYFDKTKYHLKYSKTEEVGSIDEIQHPIIKAALRLFAIDPGIEICSLADIHSGTGLGSSSSFTVALINALYAYKHPNCVPPPELLAETACQIEIGILEEPIGKQDQYAAAFGLPMSFMKFRKFGKTEILPFYNKLTNLESRLLLFYTGQQRDAKTILEGVSRSLEWNQGPAFKLTTRMVDLAYTMKDNILFSDLHNFGRGLGYAWEYKRQISHNVTNRAIDALYAKGMNAGATGGKLLGAGGSGFLLFYCEPEKQERLRSEMGLQELPFKFNSKPPTITRLT